MMFAQYKSREIENNHKNNNQINSQKPASHVHHEKRNQFNYCIKPHEHAELNRNSTYLAYRDLPVILDKYLLREDLDKQWNILDYGCGSGFSTQIISNIFRQKKLEFSCTAIDINENNIQIAKKSLPEVKFYTIKPEASTQHLPIKNCDLILCNFVLVENTSDQIPLILQNIQSLLSETGIAIITNCTAKTYNKANKWATYDNDFAENEPTIINGKRFFKEDQPVKVRVFPDFDQKTNGFTFYDFYHSGSTYKKQFKQANLKIESVHKPLGQKSDQINWKSETRLPLYSIYILKKDLKPQPTLSEEPSSAIQPGA